MIAHSIKIAQASGLFDQIIVSTDDPEIAAIATKWGASAPFLRPKELSDDFTGTIPVILHAIKALGLDDPLPLCCLYPTAPLLDPKTLQKGLESLSEGVAYTFGAVAYDYPPQRSFTLKGDSPCMLFPEHFQTRSQDLPTIYHDAGQFYWARVATWKRQAPIFTPDSRAIVLESARVQDIDTLEDWNLAELKYRLLKGES